jgi:hypothetical protein
MSLTKVSYSMIDGETVNVLDFGADPTGATDSTAAFQAAVATLKIIMVPFGTYRVDSAITQDSAPVPLSLLGQVSKHTNVNGDGRVVIDLSNNTTHFISMGYAPRIDNIQFKNGVDVFHYTTEGGDCSIMELNHVRAFGFTGTFFKCYGFGNGTHVTWNNPVILSNNASAVVWDDATAFPTQGLDNLTINDAWIETLSTVAFKISVGRFSIYGTRFIPYNNPGSVWIDHYGTGVVEATATDFGGESARRILTWRDRGGDISFKNCGLFGFPAGRAISLFAAPDAIALESLIADGNPSAIIDLELSMSAADVNYLLTKTDIKVDSQSKNALNNLTTASNAAASALVAKNFPASVNTAVDVLDCVAGLGVSYISSSNTVNATTATGASAPDLYGANSQGIKYTASLSATASGDLLMNTSPGLSSMAAGWHTIEAVVNVQADGARFTLLFSEEVAGVRAASKVFWLAKGTHRICFPCFYNTGLVKNAGFTFELHAGGVLTVTRMKVFAGCFNSRDFDMQGTAAPTGATIVWEKGDRLVNSVPTVGQPKAWVCTVAGAPGTWVSEGNL